jgi:hypothetical protein
VRDGGSFALQLAASLPVGVSAETRRRFGKTQKYEHAFVDTNWTMLGCTEGVSSLLSITVDDIQHGAVMMTDIIPDLQNNAEELFKSDGMVLALKGLPVNCRVQCVEIDLKPDPFFIVQFSEVVDSRPKQLDGTVAGELVDDDDSMVAAEGNSDSEMEVSDDEEADEARPLTERLLSQVSQSAVQDRPMRSFESLLPSMCLVVGYLVVCMLPRLPVSATSYVSCHVARSLMIAFVSSCLARYLNFGQRSAHQFYVVTSLAHQQWRAIPILVRNSFAWIHVCE